MNVLLAQLGRRYGHELISNGGNSGHRITECQQQIAPSTESSNNNIVFCICIQLIETEMLITES